MMPLMGSGGRSFRVGLRAGCLDLQSMELKDALPAWAGGRRILWGYPSASGVRGRAVMSRGRRSLPTAAQVSRLGPRSCKEGPSFASGGVSGSGDDAVQYRRTGWWLMCGLIIPSAIDQAWPAPLQVVDGRRDDQG